MALVRHERQVSGWRGWRPDRWTDGTSQAPLHGRRREGARAVGLSLGEAGGTHATERWCGLLTAEEPGTGWPWAPGAAGTAPSGEADRLTTADLSYKNGLDDLHHLVARRPINIL